MSALENDLVLNSCNNGVLKTHETTKGRYSGATWMHPYLFMKFCFWLSPELELEAIKFIYDNLIDFRLQAGDYYKEMCKAMCDAASKYYGDNFKIEPYIFVNEAKFLNLLVFGTEKPEQRNTATEGQLDLMNKLQKLNIRLLSNNATMGKEYRHNELKKISESYKILESL